jgi:hypothetical protein
LSSRPPGSDVAGDRLQAESTVGPARSRVLAPLLLPATAVLFNLFVLRAELRRVWSNHDGALHEAMIRYASDRIARGRMPFDGWFPYLTAGHPQMHHYQSLPAVIGGTLERAGLSYSYGWTMYVLLATWPVAVYIGMRLMGWERWPSAAAAMLAPLIVSTPRLGFEYGAYIFGGLLGVWTQLWGMWLLPIAWGASWRAVTKGTGYASAAAAIGFTLGLHFLTGYLAAVAVGVWVLVAGRGVVRRAGRALVVGLGSAAVAAWILVPFVLDRRWGAVNKLAVVGFWLDSYGARQAIEWLFTGRLYDAGRPPVLSILVATGFVVCVSRFRRDARARAVLGVWSASFVLFMGRPTFAWLINRLPLGEELLLSRFLNGVQLAGVIMGGVGAVWLAGHVRSVLVRLLASMPAIRVRAPAVAAAVLVVLCAVALAPAWSNRAHAGARSARLIEAQRRAEIVDAGDVIPLIQEVRRRGDGRVYAGFPWEWGAQFRVGLIPVHRLPLYEKTDSIGYTFRTASVLTDVESKFDENNLAAYDLFGVRYLLYPTDRRPTVPAQLLETRGRFALWRVDTPSGYLKLVHTTSPITAERDGFVFDVEPFVVSAEVAAGKYPTVAYDGQGAEAPTDAGGVHGPPVARIDRWSADLEDGRFEAVVTMREEAVLLLKASYHGRWRATVDGEPADTYMVAPGYVGVGVPFGARNVEFRYAAIGFYPWLFGLGALVLVALWLVPRFRRRRSSA